MDMMIMDDGGYMTDDVYIEKGEMTYDMPIDEEMMYEPEKESSSNFNWALWTTIILCAILGIVLGIVLGRKSANK